MRDPIDDFPMRVKRKLAASVGYRCSRPDCRASTAGPCDSDAPAVNEGVAAHITAAAPAGPRYDPSLTNQQRASYENGIWLCQNCAVLIDRDIDRFPVTVLRRWKKAAEDRASRELGVPNVAGAGGLYPDDDRFRHIMEVLTSPEATAIARALFDNHNPYAESNRTIALSGASLVTDRRAWPVCHINLRAIVEDLLGDLAQFANARDGVYRFVTTNTSIERVGLSVWTDEEGFRTLVDRTRSILTGARASFDFWRIFLLRSSAGVVRNGEVAKLRAALDENIASKANVAVASTAGFAETLPLDFSDFYCVPDRLAYINVVPSYLPVRFDATRDHDVPIVRCYSDIAESLVQRATTSNNVVFAWRGGTEADLADALMLLRSDFMS